MTRGNNGQVLFRHDYDYERYLQVLAEAARRQQVSVYHFVLLPRYVHLLVHALLGTSLTKMMRSVNLSYSWHYRKRYEYTGHLWQGRFQSRVLADGAAALLFGRSLELKPVYAGLAKEPSGYLWSSFRAYAEGIDGLPLSTNPHYQALGESDPERQSRYRQLSSAPELRVSTNRSAT